MLKTIKKKKHFTAIYTPEKKLDIRKLKLLLNQLGFNPVSNGTLYIIEELEFFYNNGILEIKNLNEAYIISARLHHIDIKKIQWNVESSLMTMNKYANTNLLKNIFYWYDNYKSITPKFFFNTMLEFLNENFEDYQE
jgi:hypothetical protein